MRTKAYSGAGHSEYREVAVLRGFGEGRSTVCMCVPVSGEECELDFFLREIRIVFTWSSKGYCRI